MTRTASIVSSALLLAVCGCSESTVRAPVEADCSVADQYEFLNIFDFSAAQTGWYMYADATPRGVPDLRPGPDPSTPPNTNLMPTRVDPPGRCGDVSMVELRAYGHNFYGVGYGDYQHNPATSRADGTGYDGISFWARSAGVSDRAFMFYVDDSRTLVLRPDPPDAGLLPEATSADQDLDEDGLVGPGDIARGTRCRLPPPQVLGDPACYKGGTQAPATPTRVPEPDECGNQFHTLINTTKNWQLFLIPFSQLSQWPCPNRLEGGIDVSDIAGMQIKFMQGTNYDIWLDNMAFYRPRSGG